MQQTQIRITYHSLRATHIFSLPRGRCAGVTTSSDSPAFPRHTRARDMLTFHRVTRRATWCLEHPHRSRPPGLDSPPAPVDPAAMTVATTRGNTESWLPLPEVASACGTAWRPRRAPAARELPTRDDAALLLTGVHTTGWTRATGQLPEDGIGLPDIPSSVPKTRRLRGITSTSMRLIRHGVCPSALSYRCTMATLFSCSCTTMQKVKHAQPCCVMGLNQGTCPLLLCFVPLCYTGIRSIAERSFGCCGPQRQTRAPRIRRKGWPTKNVPKGRLGRR